MAGGCALNGVANARILRDTPFRNPYLQAAASDDGTCMGAAYYVWHRTLGRKERFHMQHAFWGPQYPDSRLRSVAEASGFALKVCADDGDLVETAAGMIADGLVVGWYQGRSEWGPRALGNRSILANPTLPKMKDTINAKIKRRESFRPFAPSVLKEGVPDYFEQTVDSPFMMHVVKIRAEWRERLPAVTHVDGTGRLQTVERANNPLYYDLIAAFRAGPAWASCSIPASTRTNRSLTPRSRLSIALHERTWMRCAWVGTCWQAGRPVMSNRLSQQWNATHAGTGGGVRPDPHLE